MTALKVCVLDMQPISPAVGGGRQRLLGLYHALGRGLSAVYVGTYDWPGEASRDQVLTPGLREICVPLSEEHHAAARATSLQMAGRGMIDIEFPRQVVLSPAYLEAARDQMRDADVVVFSHPWCYPPLAAEIKPEQLVVYDSHNVEAVLRTSLHDDLPQSAGLLELVAEAEADLLARADLVLACSHEDRVLFNRIYETPWNVLRVVPNGIFTRSQWKPSMEEKRAEKLGFGVSDDPVVAFLGSGYGPNNRAANFIVSELARQLPKVRFVLMGGCCEQISTAVPDNVILAGIVDDEIKQRWLRAADMALNPLDDGSGTSIKMFDYMAAGLPVVATDIGARGIETSGRKPFMVCGLAGTADAVTTLIGDASLREKMGVDARVVVDELYSWERISDDLGRLLLKFHGLKQAGHRPEYSVLIPSYERPALLQCLLERLAQQSVQDFEVIVVDQSAEPWSRRDVAWPFSVQYIHTDVRGAVKARNTAAQFAIGQMLAFTDDDCLPEHDWLEKARLHLSHDDVVGVEGLIRSDHLNDPAWRPVTNVGFEGVGFMTANLFVRNDIFQQLGGFDLAFDCPHFREDTDMGWRMQELGRVPYASDVVVFHPAQRRDTQRESLEERNQFFEKDALLLAKHPEKYSRLFFAESHYMRGAGFWKHFRLGAEKYGVAIPGWIEDLDEQQLYR